jgi:hypothetical protein
LYATGVGTSQPWLGLRRSPSWRGGAAIVAREQAPRCVVAASRTIARVSLPSSGVRAESGC